jgi:hypothetical protein
MRRTLVNFASLAVLAIVGLSGHGMDGQVPVETAATGEVYTRGRANGDASLLLSLAMNGGKIAEVKAELPSDKKVAAGYLPSGWTHQQNGKRIVASGPPVDVANLRFDMKPGSDKDFIGKKTMLTGGMSGRQPATIAMTIGELEKITVTPNLEGILTLPPEAVPGQPILLGAPDAYRKGAWTFVTDGGPVPIVAIDRLRDEQFANIPIVRTLKTREDVVQIVDRVMFTTPPLITIFPESGAVTRVKFVDRWGELLVDAPVPITAVPAPSTCPLNISDASPFGFAGQATCVAGCFPNLAAAYGLKMDGTTELKPWAVSPTTAMYEIPADTRPGPHTLTGPNGAGTVTIGVLGAEGSIDKDVLWKGMATTMRLRIVGTDRPLPLAVLNRTPSIITVEGGEYQMVTSPGGPDNAITRSVRGIRRGGFEIVYSLSLNGCGNARRPSGQ